MSSTITASTTTVEGSSSTVSTVPTTSPETTITTSTPTVTTTTTTSESTSTESTTSTSVETSTETTTVTTETTTPSTVSSTTVTASTTTVEGSSSTMSTVPTTSPETTIRTSTPTVTTTTTTSESTSTESTSTSVETSTETTTVTTETTTPSTSTTTVVGSSSPVSSVPTTSPETTIVTSTPATTTTITTSGTSKSVETFPTLTTLTTMLTTTSIGPITQTLPSSTNIISTTLSTFPTTKKICDDVFPPRQPGEQWRENCTICTCHENNLTVSCVSICENPVIPPCNGPGEELVRMMDCCCPTLSCECNVNLCPDIPNCPVGYKLINTREGRCCPTYDCVPEAVCVYNNIEYQPGDKISSNVPLGIGLGLTTKSSDEGDINCYECSCSNDVNPTTGLLNFICHPVVCDSTCQEGFEYEPVPGQCCGECVQKKCIFTGPDNTVHVIEVNSTSRGFSSDAGIHRCVDYTCKNTNGQFVAQEVTTICPAFDSSNCEPGTETTDARGCCQICKQKSFCNLKSHRKTIEVDSCRTSLNVTFCEGQCGSSSIYSAAAKKMMHQCECCTEDEVSVKQVELICDDGRTLQHSYTVVESCHCNKAKCVKWAEP